MGHRFSGVPLAIIGVVVLVVVGGLSVPVASMAPPDSEDFEDTAGIHQSAIDALNAEGVLTGTDCAPKRFCPDGRLPRWVMAVWLVRAIAGKDADPITSSRFADVDPSEWWAPYVDSLADLGVTAGCDTSPARYCPYNTVTRAQMATFLARAFLLDGATPSGFVGGLYT